ncbi:hypothetical protein [Plasmodium yoelii yoelii]|uniref:Uncharacterized protein n=1 Tax=Plasmodium yoelii yoelii TaxID=73239 RepID=Q7RS73_PLAYO|nr:hypothetical protein [Plasmodium yoelii yoelii]
MMFKICTTPMGTAINMKRAISHIFISYNIYN